MGMWKRKKKKASRDRLAWLRPSSTVTKNYRHMRGKEFFALTRHEVLPHWHQAYPSVVCEERATKSARKRTAARRVAPNLACAFVAPSVEYRCGYTPSLAPRHRPNSEQRMCR